jgi:hypothetical protein
MEAKLDAHLDRTRDEIKVLFASRTNHDKRLGEIERSYVPSATCVRLHEASQDKTNELERTLTDSRISVARITTWVVVVTGIANVAVGAAFRYLWR